MYTYKNHIYADAGKLLHSGNIYSYRFGDGTPVTELDISLDDMQLKGNLITYCNDLLVEQYIKDESYGSLKARLIHKLFSNDDQIAILLNKDDSETDLLIYNKMQEWRAWCSLVAHKMQTLK